MEFVMRVLNAFAMFPNELNDSLLWRTDDSYAPVTFMVNCSDTFDWATADCEIIEPSDIDDLEKAIEDCRTEDAGDTLAIWHGPLLWVARKRGRKPMPRFMESLSGRLFQLFDSIEERESSTKSSNSV